MTSSITIDIALQPIDNRRLLSLCGRFDNHLRQIEQASGVEIVYRGHSFQVTGLAAEARRVARILNDLYTETAARHELKPEQIHLALQTQFISDSLPQTVPGVRTRNGEIQARTLNQKRYLQRIQEHDINFGIGPAGTGKTFLAVASAVRALEQGEVRQILLVRPAVEAGENLGFLPGDLSQKIDPYLRPLYDALYEMLGFERVARLIERHIIEVAPLAYMRGRTLNDAFIILDESQNTTGEQMKMFLTRIGYNSKAVITGDITQIDLSRGRTCGLKQALKVLNDIPEISFTFFEAPDVVRHAIVQKIVEAYEAYAVSSPTDQHTV